MSVSDPRWSKASAAGARAAAGFILARPQRLTGPSGEAIGAGIGQSIEFMDFREYEPGDDLRRIDWSSYARSDRLIVRRYREDIRPIVEVFLDGSRSMDLDESPKGEGAVALASAVLVAARSGGFISSLFLAGAERARPIPSFEQWPGFHEVANESLRSERQSHMGASSAIRILISDLLLRGSPQEIIRRFARGARRAIIIHILARGDTTAPATGTMRLRDRETGGMLILELDETALREFDQRVRAFLGSCRDACVRAGAVYVPVIAEEIFDGDCRIDSLLRAGVLSPR